MAPRRHNSTGPSAIDVHSLLTSLESSDSSSLDTAMSANHSISNAPGDSPTGSGENLTRCCVPTGDCFKSSAIDIGLINLNDLRDCIRVICNNDSCTVGQYMHRECFENWEQGVLSYLKSIGRARSWSDRQRQQNLWTKKGYDLVFKACGCKCGRGHLKKDLDWMPPLVNNLFGRSAEDEANKKKKKRNRNNQKPMLAIATPSNGGYHPNSHMNNGVAGSIISPIELRTRAGSLSSSNGSTSPPVSGSSEHSISPIHSNTMAKKQKSKIEAYSERVR